jgi:hypothetical protein
MAEGTSTCDPCTERKTLQVYLYVPPVLVSSVTASGADWMKMAATGAVKTRRCFSGHQDRLTHCFSNFARPRPGKSFFYKARARFQQIIGLQAIFMTGHKQRYSIFNVERFRCPKIPDHSWLLPCLKIRGLVTDICKTEVLGLSFSAHSRILFSSEYSHYKIHEKCFVN